MYEIQSSAYGKFHSHGKPHARQTIIFCEQSGKRQSYKPHAAQIYYGRTLRLARTDANACRYYRRSKHRLGKSFYTQCRSSETSYLVNRSYESEHLRCEQKHQYSHHRHHHHTKSHSHLGETATNIYTPGSQRLSRKS